MDRSLNRFHQEIDVQGTSVRILKATARECELCIDGHESVVVRKGKLTRLNLGGHVAQAELRRRKPDKDNDCPVEIVLHVASKALLAPPKRPVPVLDGATA